MGKELGRDKGGCRLLLPPGHTPGRWPPSPHPHVCPRCGPGAACPAPTSAWVKHAGISCFLLCDTDDELRELSEDEGPIYLVHTYTPSANNHVGPQQAFDKHLERS